MKNGLPRRHSFGSLSQAAVKPQAHITRQARPFTACTSVQIMPNSGARAVYDQIVAMLREHNTIPSFMSGW